MKINIVEYLFPLFCIANCELIFTDVLNNIQIIGNLVNATMILELFSNDSDNKKDVDHFIYKPNSYLSHCKVEFFSADDEMLIMKNDMVLLKRPLRHNEKVRVHLYQMCINFHNSISEKRKLHDREIHVYKGNLHFYAQYKILNEVTIVHIPAKDLIDTNIKPTHEELKRIIFISGNLAPNSDDILILRYENHYPNLVVSKLNRQIDVSHYGMIKVTEDIELMHKGSKIAEPYTTRFRQDSCTASHLHTSLPSSAMNVRVSDHIGLIHLWEHMRRPDHTLLSMVPRFHLIGGWKIAYTVEYSVPSYEYLYRGGGGASDGSSRAGGADDYALKIRIMDNVPNAAYVERLKVTVLLPEGAKLQELHHADHFNSSFGGAAGDGSDKRLTTLSVFGRAAIVFDGSYLNEMHISDAVVEYKYPKSYLFRAPLLLAAYVQVVFLSYMLLIRLRAISID